MRRFNTRSSHIFMWSQLYVPSFLWFTCSSQTHLVLGGVFVGLPPILHLLTKLTTMMSKDLLSNGGYLWVYLFSSPLLVFVLICSLYIEPRQCSKRRQRNIDFRGAEVEIAHLEMGEDFLSHRFHRQ